MHNKPKNFNKYDKGPHADANVKREALSRLQHREEKWMPKKLKKYAYNYTENKGR